MGKKLTIQAAVEAFEFYHLYNEVIDSYAGDLDDPSISDLHELIDEHEEVFEFVPDSKGEYTKSFERNLRQAVAAIIEIAEDLTFVDDEFEDDEIPEIYGDDFENDTPAFDIDFEEDEDPYED